MLTITQDPSYTTRADIAVVRTGFVVNLNPDFRTISDTDPNAMALDQVGRRRSLVALGRSLSFAEAVIARIGMRLPEALRSPEALQDLVEVRADNDLIQIDVTDTSPEQAALIANAWAETYVDRVNELFGETTLTSDSFNSQTAQAKQDYDAKQQALEEYLGTSPVDRLTRERSCLPCN